MKDSRVTKSIDILIGVESNESKNAPNKWTIRRPVAVTGVRGKDKKKPRLD